MQCMFCFVSWVCLNVTKSYIFQSDLWACFPNHFHFQKHLSILWLISMPCWNWQLLMHIYIRLYSLHLPSGHTNCFSWFLGAFEFTLHFPLGHAWLIHWFMDKENDQVEVKIDSIYKFEQNYFCLGFQMLCTFIDFFRTVYFNFYSPPPIKFAHVRSMNLQLQCVLWSYKHIGDGQYLEVL